jgi:hypothetical protein
MPSQSLRVPELANSWAAYQFDNAVLYVGLTVENALAEREKVGDEYRQKYTLEQLLSKEFRLPAPVSPSVAKRQIGQQLRQMFAGSAPNRRKEPRPLPPTLAAQLQARGIIQ